MNPPTQAPFNRLTTKPSAANGDPSREWFQLDERFLPSAPSEASKTGRTCSGGEEALDSAVQGRDIADLEKRI